MIKINKKIVFKQSAQGYATKENLSFTIMMELFLRTRSGGEIQRIRHGLRSHRTQQPVNDGIAGVIRVIQRISQCLVGPDKSMEKF